MYIVSIEINSARNGPFNKNLGCVLKYFAPVGLVSNRRSQFELENQFEGKNLQNNIILVQGKNIQIKSQAWELKTQAGVPWQSLPPRSLPPETLFRYRFSPRRICFGIDSPPGDYILKQSLRGEKLFHPPSK